MPINAFAPPVFQSFDVRTSPKTVAGRLKALRAEMAGAGLDGFLVPRADAHRGESVPASEARLAFMTSFTGSAGMAVIGMKKAGLLVDSRYTLQAPAETNTRLVTVIEAAQASLSPRIAGFVPKGGKIGYDPWLHTPGEISDMMARLDGHAILVPGDNLVDRIWTDRPAPPVTPVEFLGHNRAGRDVADKLAELRVALAAEAADAVVLTLPESINWLFNMRGRDVPNVPVVLAFAIVPRTGMPVVYFDRAKIDAALKKGLSGKARVADVKTMADALRRLGAAGKRVWLDPASCPVAILSAVKEAGKATVIEKRDPVLLPKAKKNDAEIGGMREAHRLDGIAMARFLHWFDAEAPKGKLTEIGIVTALEAFRREAPSLVDISFDAIAGAGPNGAIVHYRVNRKSDRVLRRGEIMLVDSGAQYLFRSGAKYLSGTTDITRTLFTGKASAEQKDRYTRVLKGMISISMARFPKGTSGAQIDVLARQHLWQAGVTYTHGTGHGVGAFLSVHEGPAGISPRYPTPLEAGMILSNEPGYYKDGAYGIRTENLMLVLESSVGGGNYLEFETLTLAPIDLRLIDERLLTEAERAWLNAYHKRVFREIGPELKGAARAWLRQATQPI